VSYLCPVCEKIWPDTMELARHVFGVGDQAHKDWVNSKGVNKGYKTLAELLKREAKKVEES
jgi:uncharacterized C2H2 Zn-finger protein